MRVSCTLVGLVSVALGACDARTDPPDGQILLYMDTDAPLASSVQADGVRPTALFDRVSFELFPPNERRPCPECSREFEVDVEQIRARRFSLGVLPRAHETGYRVRLRLFRSAGRATPRPESTIEIVAELPAIDEEGIIPLTARFRTDDVGQPRGTLAAPITLDAGAPTVSLVDTWPRARIVDCAGSAPPGSVCVPGGAFFMGDPRVAIQPEGGGTREHLVVLAPFFLDAREVTFADVRASKVFTVDESGKITDPREDCGFEPRPGPLEGLPAMCMTPTLAKRHCQTRGGSLPTEAQFEMVASLRGTSLSPWGDDEPSCVDAVSHLRLPKAEGGCGSHDFTNNPAPAGTGKRDRVRLPGGEIVDLGANLAEWVADTFQFDSEPCWQRPLLENPLCTEQGHLGAWQSTKGSDLERWPPSYAAARRGYDVDYPTRVVGFRCAFPSR